MTTRRLQLCVLLPIFLTACSTPLPKREPSFSPVAPADLRPPPNSTGSIYQAGYDTRLFEDPTARRVGDVLTVTLNEQTNSSQRNQNKDEKKDSASISLPTLFGLGGLLFGADMKTAMSSERKFDGKGDNSQNNVLRGAITVTVVEVLPNGNLKIRGEKRIALNQGDEFVRLSGIVRPADVTSGNIIDSQKIADATFMYTGEGATADASTQGWLGRFFNSPWFPL
jgi:flagellar L-ring protein precursor FlgH